MTSLFFPKRAVGNQGSFGTPYIQDLRIKYARAQSRRTLLELDERLLQDIGLTRYDVISGKF